MKRKLKKNTSDTKEARRKRYDRKKGKKREKTRPKQKDYFWDDGDE